VHVCVDDHSRLAYAEVLADEKAVTAIGFLRRAVAFYNSHGITIQRLMTDNGSAYRSGAHAIACRELAIRHLTTQPYRPRTNGKAERFIQTLTRRWPTAAPTTPAPNAPQHSTHGSTTTTTPDPTSPSATSHQAHD
jgi:transposase InsO family protein